MYSVNMKKETKKQQIKSFYSEFKEDIYINNFLLEEIRARYESVFKSLKGKLFNKEYSTFLKDYKNINILKEKHNESQSG